MPRVLADKAELERIAWQLAAAKHVLEADILFNLVTHPLRNAILEIEIWGLIGDIDKLLQACHEANHNYFHGEALIDASHDQLLSVLGAVERNFGAGLSGATALTMANVLAISGIGGSAAAGAKLSRSFAETQVRNTLPSLVSRLSTIAGQSKAQVRIESQVLTSGRCFTVFIPGTQAWSPIAGKNPLDLNSSLRALASDTKTAAANSVRAAMKLSGIGSLSGDRVTFVGHSLGGLVATQLAKQAHTTGNYQVSAVVTVGSPSSAVEVPQQIPIINLEHSDDPVVYADGAARPDTQNHKTFIDQADSLRLDNHPLAPTHDLETYRLTALQAEQSSDPQLQHLVAGLHQNTAAGTVNVQLYDLERLP